jgi:Phytanoyl-CoA dioxygenase (PhyH)
MSSCKEPAMLHEQTQLPWVARISEAFPAHLFARFHAATLPDLVERNGHLVSRYVQGLEPIAFATPAGDAFCWQPCSGGIEVMPGLASAQTVVELSPDTFSDHLNQLISAMGAVQTRRATVIAGSLDAWRNWEPAIRSLIDGKPVYDEDILETLIDRGGKPLPLDRSFAVGDPAQDMAHYLGTMGYLHVRGVFAPDEVAGLHTEVLRCMKQSVPGDPRSWWSLNSKGEELVTRINHCERFSQVIGAMSHDPRLAHYAGLAAPFMRVCDDRLDGPMVFVKHADVVEGKGDLWWHIDDGIGGSPVMNPLIQAGIQLDKANAANGQVLFMAGSHRCNKRPCAWGDEGDLPVVALATEPGDLTIHFGDTMHSTPPPTSPDAGRRVLYYKFAQPKTFAWVPAGCHYNDALYAVDDHGNAATRAAPAY